MIIKFHYKFGAISKGGYRHFTFLNFSHGSDGFLLTIIGLGIIVKFNKK